MPILTPCAEAGTAATIPQATRAADKIPDFILSLQPFLFLRKSARTTFNNPTRAPLSNRPKVWEPGTEPALPRLRSRCSSGLFAAPAVGEVAHDHVEDRREDE